MSVLEQVLAIEAEAKKLLAERDEAVARAEAAERENGELLDRIHVLEHADEKAIADYQRQVRDLSAQLRRAG